MRLIFILLAILPQFSLALDRDLPVFKHIVISSHPYSSFETALEDEERINWDKETEKANAITSAFAAAELKSHFKLLGKEVSILNSGPSSAGHAIVLILKEDLVKNHPEIASNIDFNTLGDQGYSIIAKKKTVFISANTRIGLLYGSYGLLRKMGFTWYNPTETVIPKRVKRKLKSYEIHKRPYIDLRGFWTFSEENLSDQRVIWLARNQFNIAGKIKPHLAKKLGIRVWGGEHNLIQEEFSKEGLFESHPEWFTLHENERFRVKAKGNYTNPSFSNPEAARYFSKRLIERLVSGDLKNIDILNVWPADRRSGRLDQSSLAQELGNFTDTLLFFYSVIADAFEEAYEEGVLNRKVLLAGISYHLTLEPPTNKEIIKKLEGQEYIHIFYPSTRDWSMKMTQDLTRSDANNRLSKSYSKWNSLTSFKNGLGVVAYNNKSNYTGLAITDHRNFSSNFDFYFPERGSLYAYMHPIKTSPGPLELTNSLMAGLSWKSLDEESEHLANEIIEKYFKNKYDALNKEWMSVYDSISKSVSNAKHIFESESLNTILFQDMYWTVPPFTKEQVISFIPLYRKGGVQRIPKGFDYSEGVTLKADFVGLDESLKIQEAQKQKWESILNEVKDFNLKSRMLNDIKWFEAIVSRYKLMSLCSDYVISEFEEKETVELKRQIQKEINYLMNTQVTDDTISPVNQRDFLNVIKRRIGID